ncbi:MAG: hypothetical protein CBB68_09690 [Rhodospirillaceae bacterium TMED8]|nr:hypothetical protein [Magnetovibrio sp.]OUT50131.1 MAG: hypothetical protein CBB68_09690 [Rhodospirillaceae bacterium TMED8]|tara:strand:- start:3011 stop:3454 length:444 start_codon:yes stop_codon:yes gene_type:complete
MNPNNKVNDLITVTGRLIEILARENEALSERDIGVVHKLLDEKAALSRVYETRFKCLAENPEILAQTDFELRDQLREVGKHVESLIDKNAKLLRTAIETNQRVIDMIAEAVKEQQPSAGTYGANAVTAQDGAAAGGRRVSLSLDQTL